MEIFCLGNFNSLQSQVEARAKNLVWIGAPCIGPPYDLHWGSRGGFQHILVGCTHLFGIILDRENYQWSKNFHEISQNHIRLRLVCDAMIMCVINVTQKRH